MEPDPKKLRVSLEVRVEQPVFIITQEGEERTVVEPPPPEKFARLVRQIDFSKLGDEEGRKDKGRDTEAKQDEKKEKTTEEQPSQQVQQQEQPAKPPGQWPWHNVFTHLNMARTEIDQMIALIDVLTQSKDQISLVQVTKAPPSLPSYNNDLALRKLTKQQELQRAGSLLLDNVLSLRQIVTRERNYFDDLLTIRTRWLITSRPATTSAGTSRKLRDPSAKQIGRLFVDYSYKSAGSSVKMEAELISTPPDGKVTLLLPTSAHKYLYLTTQHGTYKCDGSNPYPTDGSFTNQLTVAQKSQFWVELFDGLTSSASDRSGKKGVPSAAQILENEIKLENDNHNFLTIQLKSSYTPIEPSESSQNLFTLHDVPFPVMEIILQQLLRQRYATRFQKDLEAYNTPLSSGTSAAGTTSETSGSTVASSLSRQKGSKSSVNMLHQLTSLYGHYCLCRSVNLVLDKITSNLPLAFVHWHITEKYLTDAFELILDSFCLSVLIKGSSITLGSHGSQTNILTVSELGKFILFQICQHIITQFYFDMLMLGYKVRYNNFSVGIAHPHKIINVELIPNDDYEVELHLTEMLSGERKITKQLFWNEMKGRTIFDKLGFLFEVPVRLRQAPPSLLSDQDSRPRHQSYLASTSSGFLTTATDPTTSTDVPSGTDSHSVFRGLLERFKLSKGQKQQQAEQLQHQQPIGIQEQRPYKHLHTQQQPASPQQQPSIKLEEAASLLAKPTENSPTTPMELSEIINSNANPDDSDDVVVVADVLDGDIITNDHSNNGIASEDSNNVSAPTTPTARTPGTLANSNPTTPIPFEMTQVPTNIAPEPGNGKRTNGSNGVDHDNANTNEMTEAETTANENNNNGTVGSPPQEEGSPVGGTTDDTVQEKTTAKKGKAPARRGKRRR